MYDSFLIDVYGVLYDGKKLYHGVLDILKKIKDSGRKIIILSNTTLISKICKIQYAEFGLIEGVHYDQFMSSGEVFKRMIPDIFTPSARYYQIFQRNLLIFEGSNLVEVEKIEDADFVYVGIVFANGQRYPVDKLRTKSGAEIRIDELLKVSVDEIDGFDDIATILKKCLENQKKLVISNPDIFAMDSIDGATRPTLCQGGIGEFYEQMGGEVLYFGKPYQPIYSFVEQYLTGSEETAMIGDTPWTDILGGNMAGHSTILTLTGVANCYLSEMSPELGIDHKIERLIEEVSAIMTHKSMRHFSKRPTQIIKSMA
jgi:HAD superfamily hydrolase (TIGR01450 family)